MLLSLSFLPMIVFAIKGLFYGRPAADDYCSFYSNTGKDFVSNQINLFNSHSGRVVMNFVYSILADNNSLSQSFVSSRFAIFLVLIVCLGVTYLFANKNLDLTASLSFIVLLYCGISVYGTLFINASWLSGIVAHTIPTILASALVFLYIFEKISIKEWVLGVLIVGLWLETSLITLSVAGVVMAVRQIHLKARVVIVAPVIFCYLVAIFNPGNRSRLKLYESPITNFDPTSISKIVFQNLADVFVIYFNNKSILLLIILLGLIGSTLNNVKKNLLAASMFLLAGFINAAFLAVTASPNYAKFDFLLPISIGLYFFSSYVKFLILGIYQSSKTIFESRILKFSSVVLFVGIFSSSFALASDQLVMRKNNWDTALIQITTAKSLGESEFEYPNFTSQIAEPGNYMPNQACASEYFGILIK